jgi:hypothetical protein
MAGGMTGKTAEPDDDSIFFAICDIEHIAKQVIRAARPASRHPMWKEYLGTMRAVTEASPDLMPWEDPEQATRITARHAKEVLFAVLEAVPDPAERDRLAKVTSKEAEKVEQRMESGETGPAVPVSVLSCAWCSRPIPAARGPKARFCKNGCRVSAHRAKKRAAERQANAGAPGGR